jgi:acetoacetyl-CoA synthetase
MYKFLQATNTKHSISPPLKTFSDLHAYSLAPGTKSQFWSDVFTSADYHYSGTIRQVVDESKPISAVPKWFEGVELNFAENMLFPAPNGSKARGSKRDGDVAVTSIREGGEEVRDVTWGELRRRSGRLAAAMKHAGVVKGDRVVVVGANSVETVCIMIAATWLGAIFSSSSTDMGVKGILQRTVQVTPKLLFFDDKAVYNGREVDLRENIAETVEGLKNIKEFLGVVVIPRFPERGAQSVKGLEKATSWDEFHARAEGESVPGFVRIGFNEPFLICYSSGTTGIPKAIVHSVGGVLVNYYKEGVLHEGNTDKDVTMQYTTVGWIMYVANVGILLFGGRSVMYDGSPFQPDAKTLIRIVEQQKVTKLGISPRWMLELAKNGVVPKNEVDLSSLRIVTCTGMVLSDQLFEWFYDVGFPKHIHLANISGGTDIVSLVSVLFTPFISMTGLTPPPKGRLFRPHEPPDPSLRGRHSRALFRNSRSHLRRPSPQWSRKGSPSWYTRRAGRRCLLPQHSLLLLERSDARGHSWFEVSRRLFRQIR